MVPPTAAVVVRSSTASFSSLFLHNLRPSTMRPAASALSARATAAASASAPAATKALPFSTATAFATSRQAAWSAAFARNGASAAAVRRAANSGSSNRSSNYYYSSNYFKGHRFQSSTAGAAEAGPGWFKRMWDSPIGLKTVHFWAPVMKWALVLAGISDLGRPAEKLSVTQNIALTATGLIWTRWCLIIKPKNYLLAAVNFFLGLVGVAQCVRIAMYRRSAAAATALPAASPVEAVKEASK